MSELSVDIVANTQQAVAQTKALGKQFGLTADEMMDLADAGDDLGKSVDDISRDLSKVSGQPFDEVRREVKQADAAIDEMGDEANEARKALDKIGTAAKDAGDDAKKGMNKASEGVSEFKDEATQSGREAAASFGGGFEDVIDFAQETLANALSGFGPVGAAAGIALAAALGTALAAAQAAQEKLQAARERATELASVLYENNGVLPMTERLNEMFTLLAEESGSGNPLLNLIDGWTDFGSTLDAVKTTSRLTGVEVKSLIDTMSGDDLERSQALLDAINGKIKELESNASTAWAWDENLRGLREVRDETEKNIEAQRLGAEIVRETGAANSKAADQFAQAEKQRTQELADADVQRTEDVASRIATVSAAWQNAASDAADYFETSEEGATTFDWSKYLTDAETTLAAADEYKRRIVTLPDDVAAEAERIFSERGAVDANAYTIAFESASDGDKARFVSAAAANSSAAGDAAARSFIDSANAGQAGWKPRDFTSKITLQVDDSAYRNYRPTPKTVDMRVKPRLVAEWE